MILETVETRGLAHLSYLLGDEEAGEAVVIDPRRDVDIYLELARRHALRITAVLETHIHADFVSGSTELAALTGAEIVGGRAGRYAFAVRGVGEGDEIAVGSLRLRVLETPGHTPEHVCYLVSGGRGSPDPWGLFTGDTLFAGEVGRPDLLGEKTTRDLVRRLHATLFGKLLRLGDEVEIYPAHGQGSPCGGRIGDRPTSTVGYERLHNTKLCARDPDEFARLVLGDLPPAPAYYPRMKALNAAGPPALRCLPPVQPLEARAFDAARRAEDALVLDTREIEAFAGAHIPGALNIALRDEFPVWAGWMLRPGQRILLVLERPDDLDTVQRHLLRIGIENIGGWLRRGMRGWTEAGMETARRRDLSVHELKERIEAGAVCSGSRVGKGKKGQAGKGRDGRDCLQILDVRTEAEWQSGHIPGARHLFVPRLERELDGLLDPALPVVTYCGSGFRSGIAASVLERQGFARVHNLPGSMKAWKAAGYATVALERGF